MPLKIYCWNVNGLRSIIAKGLEHFIAEHSPDILCLQEIKICDSALKKHDLISSLGYSASFHCAEKKGYSGVATLWKTDLSRQPTSLKVGLGIESFDREGRFIVHSLDDYLLYNIYFPSGTSSDLRQEFKYEFLEAIYQYFASLSQEERKRAIICGDFNICHKPIDIHHPKTAEKRKLTGFLPEERAWIDRFQALGFIDCFRQFNGHNPGNYTWWSFRANARDKNLGWRIDYFFLGAEAAKSVIDASIHSEVFGSDHCPISLTLSCDEYSFDIR